MSSYDEGWCDGYDNGYLDGYADGYDDADCGYAFDPYYYLSVP